MDETLKIQIVNDGLTLSDYLSILTVIGAWISVFITINFNKKNMKIINEQYKKSMPCTKVKLIEYYKKKNTKNIQYHLELDIQNCSLESNSYNKAEFNIYYRSNNELYRLVLTPKLDILESNYFQLPINLSGKTTVKKKFLFEISNDDLNHKTIDFYTLDLFDIHQNCISDKIILINEVILDE